MSKASQAVVWTARGGSVPRTIGSATSVKVSRDAQYAFTPRSSSATAASETAIRRLPLEAVGLASRTRWLLEDELKELGVEFSRGEIWKPYMVEDRNLITGQNPHSAAILADRLLQILE